MELGPSTLELLRALDAMSGGRLRRKEDVGTLVELANRYQMSTTLEELVFEAKFISKSHGMMTRVGRDGEGYERLSKEFTGSIHRAIALTRTLVQVAPEDVRSHFDARYFPITTGGLEEFLLLADDLRWYKNWLLDRKRRRS
jgi:hypothetical protein